MFSVIWHFKLVVSSINCLNKVSILKLLIVNWTYESSESFESFESLNLFNVITSYIS